MISLAGVPKTLRMTSSRRRRDAASSNRAAAASQGLVSFSWEMETGGVNVATWTSGFIMAVKLILRAAAGLSITTVYQFAVLAQMDRTAGPEFGLAGPVTRSPAMEYRRRRPVGEKRRRRR